MVSCLKFLQSLTLNDQHSSNLALDDLPFLIEMTIAPKFFFKAFLSNLPSLKILRTFGRALLFKEGGISDTEVLV